MNIFRIPAFKANAVTAHDYVLCGNKTFSFTALIHKGITNLIGVYDELVSSPNSASPTLCELFYSKPRELSW